LFTYLLFLLAREFRGLLLIEVVVLDKVIEMPGKTADFISLTPEIEKRLFFFSLSDVVIVLK